MLTETLPYVLSFVEKAVVSADELIGLAFGHSEDEAVGWE